MEKKEMQEFAMVVKEVLKEDFDRLERLNSLVLDEVDRVEVNLQKVEKNLEDIASYYRIDKLENENTTLLLGIIRDLKKRVEELENRIA